MRWRDTLRSAFSAVFSHRLRSALTMLGILIGIGAVVLTVGLGDGAKAEVREQINALGTNLLMIRPGSSTDSSGARGGFGSASTLTAADAAALTDKDAAPEIEAVAPVSESRLSVTAGSTNWTTTVTGTTPSWSVIRSRTVSDGRFLTDDDQQAAAAVVVLGPDTADELFGSANVAVGQDVTVSGLRLEVVGVLSELGSSADETSNDVALVPLSTYAQRLVGGTGRGSVSTIYVKATDDSTLSAAYQEATALLMSRHGITAEADADFAITTQESVLSAATSVDDTMTVMLGGIAVISLLVGGIGVMNIMLVSVTERVREIGLRKAIGGRPRAIRRQFLVEASILGLAGGILGVGVGLLGARIVPELTDARVIVSVPSAVIAVVMAMVIGVLFGVYPAARAARLVPIDALRSE